MSWPTKDAAEKFAVEFDFSRLATTVDSATVSVSLLTGTDATPSALLDGAAQVSGAKVYQRVKAGVAGCNYRLRCEATAGSDVWALAESLPVRVAD
jgi:hypothetical protein